MATRRLIMSLAWMAAPMLVAGQDHGPPIVACGDLLPAGSHYSLQVELDWNRRGESPQGELALSLTDERTGQRPEAVPEEVVPFVGCVQEVLGIPGEPPSAP